MRGVWGGVDQGVTLAGGGWICLQKAKSRAKNISFGKGARRAGWCGPVIMTQHRPQINQSWTSCSPSDVAFKNQLSHSERPIVGKF